MGSLLDDSADRAADGLRLVEPLKGDSNSLYGALLNRCFVASCAGAGLPSGPRPSEPLALANPAVVHGTANGATSVAPGALAAADELTRRRDVDAYGGDYEDGGDGDGDDSGGAGCGLGCLFGRRKHKTAKSGRAGRAGGPPASKEPAATVQVHRLVYGRVFPLRGFQHDGEYSPKRWLWWECL